MRRRLSLVRRAAAEYRYTEQFRFMLRGVPSNAVLRSDRTQANTR